MTTFKQPIVRRTNQRETKVFTSAELREASMTPREQDYQRELISAGERHIAKWSVKGLAETVERTRANVEERERRLDLAEQIDAYQAIESLRDEIDGLDDALLHLHQAEWYRGQSDDIYQNESRSEELAEDLDTLQGHYESFYAFDIVVINPKGAR